MAGHVHARLLGLAGARGAPIRGPMCILAAVCALLALTAPGILPVVSGSRTMTGDATDVCRASWRVHRPKQARRTLLHDSCSICAP